MSGPIQPGDDYPTLDGSGWEKPDPALPISTALWQKSTEYSSGVTLDRAVYAAIVALEAEVAKLRGDKPKDGSKFFVPYRLR